MSAYRRTASADTAPAAAAQYDRDHTVGSRDRGCGNLARSRREVKIVNWLAIGEGEPDR